MMKVRLVKQIQIAAMANIAKKAIATRTKPLVKRIVCASLAANLT